VEEKWKGFIKKEKIKKIEIKYRNVGERK